ncbi:MAG: sensor histidine kinase [Bacteroidetes bacterium]|nr:MAG: sensor histidine kinase [Bacteroidota bacterium]
MVTDDQLLQELEKRFRENKESLLQLQKMTSELKEVNKKLEESEALKTHFISNITNEIINPFAAILGLSRNILDVKKENWDKVISMVHLIHSEAFNLDFQLKNVFAAAKLEAGEWIPDIMNVNVNQLINSTLDGFKYEAAKKRIELYYDFDVSPGIEKSFYFLTDPEKLKIIISNLLSNAVKYSNSESEVTVKARLEGENLCVSVIDKGIGVSEKNKKIIFDRFKRVDNGINSVNRGHGLGLSVNKAILDLLGGEIEMTSIPNEETVFTICIPPGERSVNYDGMASDGNEFLFDNDGDEIF